ncbi:glycosyltransferase family 4 protein [Methanospirillum lacunae]|nr:glycosyltransferase family 4 protein [Methanospirillum lacunae]
MITSAYPSNITQSHGIIIASLANALSQKGIEICILAPKTTSKTPDTLNENVKVFRFNYFFRRKMQILSEGPGLYFQFQSYLLAKIQIPFFLFFELIFLILIIKKENPDLIHTHWIIPHGIIGAIVHKFLGIPHLISIHGTDAYIISSNRYYIQFLKMVLSNSNAISANSTHNAKMIEPFIISNSRKISIIPMGMGIQIPPIPSLKTRQINRKKNLNILFVGRLIELKGVDILIKAFVHILEKKPIAKLIIIGDGPEFQSLKQYSHNFSISHAVKFTGRLSKDELYDYYKIADLLVLPSRIVNGQCEGLGVVLLEAMAAGIPVIGSNIGGIPDIIIDKVNGLLVPQGEPHVLAEAVIQVLENPKLAEKFKKAGLETVNERFSWDIISAQFVDIYKKVLNK